MKTQALIVTAALLMLAGCASPKQDDAAAASNTGGDRTATGSTGATGTGTDPATTGFPSGSTVSLVLNGSALSRMFYNSHPQNPQNPRINISLGSTSAAVTVSYVENGKVYNAVFGTQHPTASYSNQMYNGWVNQSGSDVWKGFFQDAYGAVVLVLDKALSQTDGTSSMILGGSLWFQNFQQSWYQNPVQGPLKMCWEITAGPYDCRSFLVPNPSGNQYNKVKVDMTSSAYPTTSGPDRTISYEKLGDFGGLDRTAAGL